MAIKVLNLHDTKDVTFPGDDNDPTVFTIGAVDSRVFGKLSDRALTVAVDANNPDGDADVKMSRNQLAFEVVQFGLKGITNLQGPDGEVKFRTERKVVGSKSYEVAHSDILASIPGNVLMWLSNEIMAMNSLGIDEGNV